MDFYPKLSIEILPGIVLQNKPDKIALQRKALLLII